MRLLHKRTHELQWFTDGSQDFPAYLVLSHRWIGQETTMQLFESEKSQDPANWSPGTAKIMRICDEALAYQPDYVWVDTCCIDKTSSAELQEAINSMFKWYERADMCLVYLDDVDLDTAVEIDETWASEVAGVHDTSPPVRSAIWQLRTSKWFTRGWTLQELVAPSPRVFFFDVRWRKVGGLDNEAILETISVLTTIDKHYLLHQESLYNAPIATRLSWMAGRQTSRVEDQAYCLLGLLNTNMTMLYGEGEKAFQRLQRKLLQRQDDESIFLWVSTATQTRYDYDGRSKYYVSALAPDPSAYACCRGLDIRLRFLFDREPIRLSGRGLEIPVTDKLTGTRIGELGVVLNCMIGGKQAFFRIGSSPRRIVARRDKEWCRLADSSLQTYSERQPRRMDQPAQVRIYVQENPRQFFESINIRSVT